MKADAQLYSEKTIILFSKLLILLSKTFPE